MKLTNDKRDINECVESIAAATHDTKHTGPHQDQAPQREDATPAQSPTNNAPEAAVQPVIVWRSLMLQQ
ncbi:hypothetical protein [Pseudomonas grimontii]|uniref:hypothetical protein n=1 Tax=Pseudomonas grimontii TaxID=129847 RepID=UPI0028ED7A46|nr:hypothetical protein [Pseudomonas grimontii]